MALPKVKASKLLAMVRAVLGMGYVYGMRGKDSPCTVAILKSKERQYGKKMGKGYYHLNGDYTKGKCARWLGKFATDCSGLFRWAYWMCTGKRYDFSKSANGLYLWCKKRGPISQMPKQAGVFVFAANKGTEFMHHVGIYAGKGKTMEAGGVIKGIFEAPMSRGWTHYGILEDIIEMDVPADNVTPPPPPPKPPTDDDDDDLPDETKPLYFTTTPDCCYLIHVAKYCSKLYKMDIKWQDITLTDGKTKPNPRAMHAGMKLIVGYKIATK